MIQPEVSNNSYQTLSDVIEVSIKEDKLVFVNLHADWCLPCKQMEKTVLTNPEVISYINEHFIPYRVDVEENNGPDLKYLYQVSAFPGLLFLDQNGRLIQKYEGSLSSVKFMEIMKQVTSSQNFNMKTI